MHWIFFGLLAALSESFKDLTSKHSLREISPLHAGLAASAIPIPLLLGFLFVGDGLPALGPSYHLALAIGGTLNILALWQFMRALQASDLSLAVPFISFTPVFLMFTSPLLVGDMITIQDIAGILCIVGGAYLLQAQGNEEGWLAPFSALTSRPGPRRMLSVALIYSVTSNFDKIGTQHSSPIFWSLSLTTVMAIGFALLLLLSPRQHGNRTSPGGKTGLPLFLIGFFQAAGLIFHNTALSLGPVPSVIAIKRTSILFAVIWGIIFLREPQAKERLAGATLMIVGMTIIALSV